MDSREIIYFIAGIVWGGWIIRPALATVLTIGLKVYRNAKKAQNEQDNKGS